MCASRFYGWKIEMLKFKKINEENKVCKPGKGSIQKNIYFNKRGVPSGYAKFPPGERV